VQRLSGIISFLAKRQGSQFIIETKIKISGFN
jgi:hypothetical protein